MPSTTHSRDAAALAGAISMLLENPPEARRLAAAGYAHVLRNYDETIEAALWRELFSGIAGMPGAK